MANLGKLEFFLESTILENGRVILENLLELVEKLENKPDPEPYEITLLSDLYQFIEKFKIMENRIINYVRKQRVTSGDKLQELYDESFNELTTFLD